MNFDRFLFTARQTTKRGREVEQRWVIEREANRLIPVYEKAGWHVTVKELCADNQIRLHHETRKSA